MPPIPISSGRRPSFPESRVGPTLKDATVRMPGHFLTTCFCYSYAMPSLIITTGSTMVVSRTPEHSRNCWERSTGCVVRWPTIARSAPTKLRDCRAIAGSCLTPIGGVHPYLIEDFLVDRWEDQVAQIVDGMRAGFDSADPPPAGSMPETQRRRLVIDALTAQRLAVSEWLSSLSRLVVPPSRQQLHDAAVTALTHWQAALADLVATGSQQDLTTAQAQAASAVYAEALDHVREVTEEIRRLRVSAPTE